MKFINLKTKYGIETVDEINPENFATIREFKDESRRLLQEYWMAFNGVQGVLYLSQRPTKDWRES